MNKVIDFKNLIENFQFEGEYIYEEPFGCGHINDTFAVYFKMKFTHPHRYIIQRINNVVFKNPEKLMENIDNITRHIREKVRAAGGDITREVLTIIPTKNDKIFYIDESGNYWRAYIFIDDSTSFQTVTKPEHFYESAKAFGRFQSQLSDFPAETLYETIPDFHNTMKRYDAFITAFQRDLAGRAKSVKNEVDFIIERKSDTTLLLNLLQEGKLPLRVTHNDTKLNNVLIDNLTDKSLCVLDLDTVMPGLAHYDFGDSIRFGASTAVEDEKDLAKVWMDISLFEAYTKGFLEECKSSLTSTEIDHLAFSAKLLTLECGMRFLTDYLNGDTYFKIHHEHHNLDRCRTQLKLVADMENKMEKMKEIVDFYAR